ncbi:hypothetical protein ACJRO7_017383 [Eucalyptus globulus]|uniref:Uncharacterized protein n=1 Tax=Eucalyptus globulus TaxID=34317 RepID=A0ABD3KR92_EUCGL
MRSEARAQRLNLGPSSSSSGVGLSSNMRSEAREQRLNSGPATKWTSSGHASGNQRQRSQPRLEGLVMKIYGERWWKVDVTTVAKGGSNDSRLRWQRSLYHSSGASEVHDLVSSHVLKSTIFSFHNQK